jgi:multicomponent Na+:H+ antiporter subunit E
LSGKFDLFHLGLGILACLLVAYSSADLMFTSWKLHGLPRTWYRFVRYIPWLLYQVLLANLHVMYLVCHPRMMELIDPHFVRFKSRLDSDLALVTLANSITLTPGTITVYASIYGDLTVHVIDIHSGQSLPGVMEAKIGAIFAD